ncbi:MAG: hypothetical protein HQ559_15385 [Lentisphaerae bacterium]|nr:hypothetical protein [Lentisphaerota bacterium]
MSKARTRTIPERVKDHALQLILGGIVGLLGTMLCLCWPSGTPLFTRACVAFISFLLFGLLGVIAGEIVALVGERDLLRQLNEHLDFSRRQTALITDASVPVQKVLIGFSKRFWGDITTEPLSVPVRDYLWILEESLAVATKHVFATSLIAPDTWFLDRNYRRYLDLQGERIRAERGLVIQRVFIMPRREFYSNEKTREVIQEHLDKGIQIGFCDSAALKPEDCVDLVLFEANGDKWVVKGGVLSPRQQSADEKNLVELAFFCRADSIDQRFAHLKRAIDSYTIYFPDIETFDNKRSKESCGSAGS